MPGDDHRWDKVFETLGKLNATCIDIKDDLKYHIKRTDLLEEKFEPVEDHVKFVQTLMKVILPVGLALLGYYLA